MSGGSYCYAYEQFERFARNLKERSGGDPLRLAFAHHIQSCARAAKAIEWEDSLDTEEGSANPLMKEIVTPVELLRADLLVALTKVLVGKLGGDE
jgi:hypothetical protein